MQKYLQSVFLAFAVCAGARAGTADFAMTDQRKADLMRLETGRMTTRAFEQMERGERVDIDAFLRHMLAYAAMPGARERANKSNVNGLYQFLEGNREPMEKQQAVIDALRASSSVTLQQLGEGLARRLALRDQPAGFKFTRFDGSVIDLAQLRGKVVLVDIWSLFCSSCIEAMPRIRAVYDRYRDRGFEVVGLCLMKDEAAERARVMRVLSTRGANWDNAFIAGEKQRAFAEEFAITGVPVTWLLDQQGRLAATDVRGGKLEKELDRLLK